VAAAAAVPAAAAVASAAAVSVDAPPARADAPAAPVRTTAPGRASTRRLVGALVAIGALAVVAFVASLVIRHADDAEAVRRDVRARLDAADKARRDGDYDAALRLYEEVAADGRVPEGRKEAQRKLSLLRDDLQQGDAEFEALWNERNSYDSRAVRSRFDTLVAKHGPAIAKRHEGLVEKIAADQQRWVSENAPRRAEEATRLAGEGRFADARRVWDAFLRDGPPADAARQAADEGRAAVDSAAASALPAVLAEASERVRAEGARTTAGWLRGRAQAFVGTPAASALEDRAAALDREAGTGAGFPPSVPTPGPGTPPAPIPPSRNPPGPTPSHPDPVVPRANPPPPAAMGGGPVPGVPTPSAANPRLDAAFAEVDAQATSRRFAAATTALDEAGKAATTPAETQRVAARREDLALAAAGLDWLAHAIGEHPDRHVDVEMTPKFFVDLLEADGEFVSAAVRGGKTKYRWSQIDPAKLAEIAERARPTVAESLPLAQLLKEAGATAPAERMLLRISTEGGDVAAAHARLARWRHESVPAGGYLAYEGRLVTPAERDRLVLEARIAAAVAKVVSTNPATRKQAYDELLAIGAPARAAFAKALRSRREAAIHEVAELPVFRAGRTKEKLKAEVEKRRAAALMLIENDRAYPYPSETHVGQEEVNRLVDLVRECWERPFDVIASWDKNVAGTMGLVSEVDDLLVKLDPDFSADVDAVKATINRSIDVPSLFPDDYSKKVLAYNERIATTAGREEKENVRAVNEYRLMMGRWAVKINERLVRAARGHSRHMRLNKYFAHENPAFPEVASPGIRCARQGYASGVGENIAMGSSTGRGAFDLWFHSSGHHRNMINRGWTEMGCGESEAYFTQNFGAMTGKGLGDPDALPPPAPDVAPGPDSTEEPPTSETPSKGKVPDAPPPTIAPPPEPPAPKPAAAALTPLGVNAQGLEEFAPDRDPTVVLVKVPAGSFTMGAAKGDKDALIDEQPAHAVALDAYLIGKTEVTWAQWLRFCDATKREKPTVAPWVRGEHPVFGLRWEEARDYAEWLGVRLPSEAEWEHAARGRVEGRLYPWGPDFDAARATVGVGPAAPMPTPVRTYEPNSFGLFDVVGNVWEWCADWYVPNMYEQSAERNPVGPSIGDERVLRGGSYGFGPRDARLSKRRRLPADPNPKEPSAEELAYVGFRVAMTPP
jgi:formylglycine-generating enzyme required for sulfatase activity/uncharacterized protein YkwD